LVNTSGRGHSLRAATSDALSSFGVSAGRHNARNVCRFEVI